MDAFFVKSEDSGPEEVHSMPDYMHSVAVWLDSLDYLDNPLFISLLSTLVRTRTSPD